MEKAPYAANAFARDFKRCSRILGSPDHKILGAKVMRPPAPKKANAFARDFNRCSRILGSPGLKILGAKVNRCLTTTQVNAFARGLSPLFKDWELPVPNPWCESHETSGHLKKQTLSPAFSQKPLNTRQKNSDHIDAEILFLQEKRFNMKSIGIKLADGSFYPLLEEGNPEKRTLDLTTVMDNQTKVQVEVYRTETGTMENAEYLDTLEITNLKPHENGEPTLCLAIDVDENNALSAEIKDPETCKTSEIQVTLHSRTLAGLSQNSSEPEEESSDVIISDDDLEKAGLNDFMEKKEFESEEIPLPAEDFSFDDVNEPAKADDMMVPQEENADKEIFGNTELDLPDFGDDEGETFINENELELGDTVENTEDPAAEEIPEPQEEAVEDSEGETIALENEPMDIFDGPDETEESEGEILSEPLIEETPEDDVFEEVTKDAAAEDKAGEDTVTEQIIDEPDFSTDLPDFDDDLSLDGGINFDSEKTVDDSSLDLGTEDLSLPDFDDLDTPALGNSDDNDSLLDLPDIDDEQKDSLTDDIEDFTLPPDFDTSFSQEPMTT